MAEISEDLIIQFRESIGPVLSDLASDLDCIRFLRARNSNVAEASEMAAKCYEWRETELPGQFTGITPNNILAATADRHVRLHPSSHLVPHMLHGEDKESRPVYWEKTGQISSWYSQVKELWSVEDLLQMHVR